MDELDSQHIFLRMSVFNVILSVLITQYYDKYFGLFESVSERMNKK